MLLIKKLKIRGAKSLAQDHTDIKWRNWDEPNPS